MTERNSIIQQERMVSLEQEIRNLKQRKAQQLQDQISAREASSEYRFEKVQSASMKAILPESAISRQINASQD